MTTHLRRASVALAASLLCVLSALPTAAAGSWQSSVIAQQDLNDVRFVNPQVGWAVGSGGTILKTTDGGQTWTRQSSGTTQVLNGVDFVDADRGWAVGAGATIRTTANGGQSWTSQTPGPNTVLIDVDFVDASHGWAVGSTAGLANLVLATKDGGATWTQQAAPAGLGLVGVSFADTLHGFAVGYFDAAYRTVDGGITWVPMAVKAETFEGNTTDSFYATVRSSASEGLLAGFRGEIYRTEDGGLTWAQVALLGQPIQGLAMSGAAAVATGNNGAVARSDDGGATWSAGTSGTTSGLKGVSAPSPGRAFAVGAFGVLTRFQDAAAPLTPLAVSLHPNTCGDLPIAWERQEPGVALVGLARDTDRDGTTEIVLSGARGIRAIRPFAPTARATIWKRPLQSPILHLRIAEIDGDPGHELVAATGQGDDARTGVVALDAEDGTVVWSRRLPSATTMLRVADLDGDGLDDAATVSPTRDLRLLSGSDGRDLRDPTPLPAVPQDLTVANVGGDPRPEAIVPMSNGRLLVFDGQDGKIRWSYDSDGDLRTAKTVDLTGDGVPDVVVGGTGMPGSVTPGRGDDPLNLGSLKGALIAALDGRDGSRLWDYGQSNPFLHFDALAFADLTSDGTPDVIGHAGRLDGSHLLALDGKGRIVEGNRTGEPSPLWRQPTSTPGEPIQQVNTPDDLKLTNIDGDGIADAITAQASGAVFAVSGRPPAPSSNISETGRPPLASIIWTQTRDWQTYQASPVKVDGRDLILTLFSDGLVSLRDPANGAVLWSFDGATFPVTAAANLDGDGADELAVGTAGGRVYGVDGDGSLLQDADLFLRERIVAVAGADTDGDGREEIVAGSIDGTVAAVDPRTSRSLWTSDLESPVKAMDSGGSVVAVALTDGRLVGLDPSSGEQLWEVEAPAILNDVMFLPGSRLFVTGDDLGTLHIVDTQGEPVAQGTSPTWIGSLTAADLDADGTEEILAATGFAFRAYRLDGSEIWTAAASNVAYDVAAGDMDGDSFDDVAAGALGREYGIGSGGNGLWNILGQHPGGAAVVDVDGDGRRDALLGSHALFGGGRIRAVRADGDVLVECEPGMMPAGITAGSFDGDQGLEAAVGSRDGVLMYVDAG